MRITDLAHLRFYPKSLLAILTQNADSGYPHYLGDVS